MIDKIILMGFTRCPVLHLARLARDMEKFGLSIIDLSLIIAISPKTTLSMSEFIKVAEMARLESEQLLPTKVKKPKYIRQQHKLAVKFSNKRK